MARSVTDIDEALTKAYGSDLSERSAVSHITAVWEEQPGVLRTIRINEHAPKSERDFFVLNASRARADAIITTGKILRDEPELTYVLAGPDEAVAALHKWRKEKWGLSEPPWILVLTSGRDLDLDHPVFHGWARPMIFTSDRGAARHLAHARIPVVADEAPSIRRAIQHLHRARGCQSVSIEAGPNTSRELYDEPRVVDELLLSVFCGAELNHEAQGDAFLKLNGVRALFDEESSGEHEEPSGPWRFSRFTCSA